MITYGNDTVALLFPDVSIESLGTISYKKQDLTLFHELLRPFKHGNKRDNDYKKIELNDEFYRHLSLKYEQVDIDEDLAETTGKHADRAKYTYIPYRECTKADFGNYKKDAEVMDQFKGKITICPNTDDNDMFL